MLQINGERMCRLAPPGAGAFPEEHISVVKRATEIISTRIVGRYKCDDIFKALPKG